MSIGHMQGSGDMKLPKHKTWLISLALAPKVMGMSHHQVRKYTEADYLVQFQCRIGFSDHQPPLPGCSVLGLIHPRPSQSPCFQGYMNFLASFQYSHHPVFDCLQYMQVIKNWVVGRPGIRSWWVFISLDIVLIVTLVVWNRLTCLQTILQSSHKSMEWNIILQAGHYCSVCSPLSLQCNKWSEMVKCALGSLCGVHLKCWKHFILIQCATWISTWLNYTTASCKRLL